MYRVKICTVELCISYSSVWSGSREEVVVRLLIMRPLDPVTR